MGKARSPSPRQRGLQILKLIKILGGVENTEDLRVFIYLKFFRKAFKIISGLERACWEMIS